MKRYIIFTGIMVGATIMAIGAAVVGAASFLGEKLIRRE